MSIYRLPCRLASTVLLVVVVGMSGCGWQYTHRASPVLQPATRPAVRVAAQQTPFAATPGVAVPPSPDFYVTPPEFAGHAVHTIVRTHEVRAVFPGGGAVDDISESWFRFAADGQPDLVHTVTTSLTGTPLSEQLLTPSGGQQTAPLTIGGLPSPTAIPGALQPPRIVLPPCPQPAGIHAPQGGNPLTALVPQFVIPSRYAAGGHLVQGKPRAPSQQPPALPSVPGVTPLKAYKPDRTVTPWESHVVTPQGDQQSQVVEIGTAGRIEYSHLRVTDAHGQLTAETERVYGELDVYPAGAVPADAFTFSGKACIY